MYYILVLCVILNLQPKFYCIFLEFTTVSYVKIITLCIILLRRALLPDDVIAAYRKKSTLDSDSFHSLFIEIIILLTVEKYDFKFFFSPSRLHGVIILSQSGDLLGRF